jgi:hypothetical protein
MCDGVQHFPVDREYNIDEDLDFCAKRQLVDIEKPSTLNIWEHFSLGILRNIFRGDETTPIPEWHQQESESSPDGSEGQTNPNTHVLIFLKNMYRSEIQQHFSTKIRKNNSRKVESTIVQFIIILCTKSKLWFYGIRFSVYILLFFNPIKCLH